MSEAKHTPGPWHVEVGDRYCAIEAIDRDGEDRTIVTIHSDLYISSEGEDYANARLIAAAPDLLEAAMAIDEYLDIPLGSDAVQTMEKNARACRLLKAAIAKATIA